MNNIVYTYGKQIYLNITNACPCNCVFCVRNNTDGLGDMGSLWLEHEPSFEEIKEGAEIAHRFKKRGSVLLKNH